MFNPKILWSALLFLSIGFPISVSGQNPDIDILKAINLNRPKQLDQVFIGITNSAAPLSFAVPVSFVGTGLITGNRTLQYQGVEIGASILGASILTYGLKALNKRPRPYITYPELENLQIENSYSFPSGHTTVAFATATSLSLLYPKWYVIAPSFLWASLVGYSRMDLGVHYPGDVLVGMLIGGASGLICHKLMKKLNQKVRKGPQKAGT